MKTFSPVILLLALLLSFSSVGFSQPFSGGSGTSESPWQISTVTELDSVRHYLDGHFVLSADIDLDVAPYNTGQGWSPIGDNPTDTNFVFSGHFDGSGYSISGLYINRESSNFVGLFGYIYKGSLSKISIEQSHVAGKDYVGTLAGFSYLSTVDSSSVKGKVVGNSRTGGLLGSNFASSLNKSFTEVQVQGFGSYVGGLVGENRNGAVISSSYAGGMGEAKAEGKNSVGGLAGYTSDARITNSYATGRISGVSYIGGLVGYSNNTEIENSYSTGSVTGSSYFAGFIGYSNESDISSNYWNTETSGQNIGANVSFSHDDGIQNYEILGLNTLQMTDQANFSGWDFEEIWDITEGHTYPWFQWQGNPSPENQLLFGPPRNLEAVVNPNNSDLSWGVELAWNTPVLGTPKGYKIYRSGKLLDVVTIDNPEAPTNSNTIWTDTTTINFSPYFYYVTSVYDLEEEVVESAPTNPVDVVVEFGLAGSGTEEDPWQIAAINELNALRYLSSGHFKLLQDIDLNEATADSNGMYWNNGKGWEPVPDFEGSLDGDGYIISGLYINSPIYDGMGHAPGTGFFSSILSGEIKNLGLTDVNITGITEVGGLSGNVSSANIINSFVTGTINGGVNVGGLFGVVSSSVSVSGCYTTGDFTGNRSVGGLAGIVYESTIAESYSLARVHGREVIGGIVGKNNEGTIKDNYAAGPVEGFYETGGIAGLNYQGTFSGNFWNKQTSEQQYGVSNAFSGTTGLTSSQMVVEASFSGWDFENLWNITEGQSYPWLRENAQSPPPVPDSSRYTTNAFDGGSGTENAPWEIATATQLDSVRHYRKAHYILTADIDLDIAPYNEGKGWQPIGQDSSYTDVFTGSFDGDKHIISGLYINRPDESKVGLFGYIGMFADVQNIGLTDVDVTGENYVGSLTGELYASNVTNTYAIGIVKGTSQVGGLVGYHYSENSFISKSYAAVQVSGNSEVGGFVGANNWSSQISDSYALGNVDGKEWTGGFAGSNRAASILRSYASGKVSADSAVGGFVGFIEEATFQNNFWNTDSTTQSTAIGEGPGSMNNVTGLSSEQMRQRDSFNNWNFNSIWDIQDGSSFPWLRQIPQDPIPGLIVGMEQELIIPKEFGLSQNYPNPFNPSTVISYQIPVHSEVSLQVFDILGKEVVTLVNGRVKAGYHVVTFNAESLASGVYIYRLKAGNAIFSKKFTLIK